MPPATAQPAAVSKKLFSAGEIDPALRTRPDTETWQAGLATFRNIVGKKSGGGRNRPGSKYVGPVSLNSGNKRLLEFDLADGFNDSFAVLCEAGITTFMKNQMKVLQAAQQITAITNANPGVFTIAGHGFLPTDVIFMENTGMPVDANYFRLNIIDANTFSLADPLNNLIDTTNFAVYGGTGATAAKVYTITNPFNNAVLPYLNYDQDLEQLKIASGKLALQDLNFFGDTNWQMQNSLFQPSISAPTGLAASVSGTASTYAVTALKNGTGEESLSATVKGATGSSGSPQTISWANEATAFFYNIYRADADGVFGLIGVAPAQGSPEFVDTNSPAPNFNIQPPGQEGTIFDFGLTLVRLASTLFPISALPGNGTAIAWSPSGDMVAVGCATTPFLLIYSFSLGGGFTLLSSAISGANIPTGTVNGLAWSPDGSYLACACSPTATNPAAILYKRVGQTLTPTAGISTQLNGNGTSCCWKSDSSVVCFTSTSSPYMDVYWRAGDTFTKYADSSVIPGAQASCCCFMKTSLPDAFYIQIPLIGGGTWVLGEVLLIGTNKVTGGTYNGTSLWAYQLRGSIGGIFPGPPKPDISGFLLFPLNSTSLAGIPPPQPGQDIVSIASANDSNYTLVLGLDTGTFLNTIQNTGFWNVAGGFPQNGSPIWSTAANAVTLPNGTVNGISPTSDGTLVVIGTAGTQKLILYELISGVLVYNGTQPTPDMYDNTLAVAFSPDASLLGAVNKTTTPYAGMYGVSVAHPACVGFAQQRLRIANTSDNPNIEYDSAEDAYTNFSLRVVPAGATAPDTDPIQFITWSRKYNAIKHLLSLKKLIQLTTNGVLVLEGDGNGNISPTEVNPRLVGYNGANYVRPAFIGDTAVYVGASGNQLWDLKKEVTASSYFASDNFFTTDLTIPSAHLFRGKNITWLCYQEKPDSVIWGGLDDGTFFSLTYVRDQGVFTFGRHDMGILGTVVDGCCIRESDGTDRVYLTMNIGTSTVPNYIQVSLQDRDNADLESQWFVDAGVSYDGRNTTPTTMNYHLGPANAPTVFSSTPIFSTASVGQVVRLHNPNPATPGYTDYEIINYFTPGSAEVTNIFSSGAGSGFNLNTTQWSFVTQTLSGLWHLNGQNVSVLADGVVVSSPNNPFLKNSTGVALPVLSVINGQVSLAALGFYAEVIIAGLPFTCDLETLELDTPSGPSLVELQKNSPRVNAKVNNTKGMFFGSKFPALGAGQTYNDTANGMFLGFHGNRQATTDAAGVPATPLLTDRIFSPIDGDWNSFGRACIRQVDPLPMEINGLYPVTAM